MGTKQSGEVHCDECFTAEDAIVHIHQNFRGSGVDICQHCLHERLGSLIMAGPDRTFFRRLDAWIAQIAVRGGDRRRV